MLQGNLEGRGYGGYVWGVDTSSLENSPKRRHHVRDVRRHIEVITCTSIIGDLLENQADLVLYLGRMGYGVCTKSIGGFVSTCITTSTSLLGYG
jgi:hypothetical protein